MDQNVKRKLDQGGDKKNEEWKRRWIGIMFVADSIQRYREYRTKEAV
jgi:hypothetical protein